MSASAFIVTNISTTIISDGKLCDLKDKRKITSENGRKVWKLSDSLALVWMGSRHQKIDLIAQKLTGQTNAKIVITNIAKYLENTLTPGDHQILSDNKPYSIFAFHYEGERPALYSLRYTEAPFTPQFKCLQPCSNGAMMVGVKNPNFDKILMGKAWPKYKNRKFKSSEDFIKATEMVVREAFKMMVDQHKEIETVGGELFIETITPMQPEK